LSEPRRVGAILSASDEEVRLLGYGAYLGEQHPPFGPFGFSYDEIVRDWALGFDSAELAQAFCDAYVNPCIRLDSGVVVWGMQCWWGDEERVKKMIGSRRVVIVDVDDKPLERGIDDGQVRRAL